MDYHRYRWQGGVVGVLYFLSMQIKAAKRLVYVIHLMLLGAILSLNIVVARIGGVEKVADVENDMVFIFTKISLGSKCLAQNL